MVASRTALVVGGITFPVGLILTIVGAAYYGDSYSTCNEAVQPWCKVDGKFQDKIYDATGKAIALDKIYVDLTGVDAHALLVATGAAGNEFRYECPGTSGNETCDILDENCELVSELKNKLYDAEDQTAAKKLKIFQDDGKTEIKVATASTHWCQSPSTGAFEDNLYSVKDTVRPWSAIHIQIDSTTSAPIGNVASNSDVVAAAIVAETYTASPFKFACTYTPGEDKIPANVVSCDILDDKCKLKNELKDKLFLDTGVTNALSLTNAQWSGAADVAVVPDSVRQLQTAVGGAFRKLTAAQDALDAAADVADDACDADFAAMVAMCVIGGILMVVGLAFFVIWWKYSSDAESK